MTPLSLRHPNDCVDQKKYDILINYFVKTPFKKSDYEFYQSISSLIVCISAFVAIYNPQQYIHVGNAGILFHCIADSLFAKWDMLLHHVCVISFCSFLYGNNAVCDDSIKVLIQMFRMEYSTIFLSGSTFLRDYLSGTASSFLEIGFVVAFFKYRIVDYGFNVVFNPETYRWHVDVMHMGWVPIAHHGVTIFVFYGLNLYWAALIVNRLYKKFVHHRSLAYYHIDSIFLCERLAKYTIGVSVLVNGYAYWSALHQDYKDLIPRLGLLIDCAGLTVLTLTSYRYHASLHDQLMGEGEESYCKIGRGVIWYLTDDASATTFHIFCSYLAITWHIQSWRFAVSALLMCLICLCISKYNSACLNGLFVSGELMRPFHMASINSAWLVGFAITLANKLVDSSYADVMAFSATQLACGYCCYAIIRLRPLNNLSHIGLHMIFVVNHYLIAQQVIRNTLEQQDQCYAW